MLLVVLAVESVIFLIVISVILALLLVRL